VKFARRSASISGTLHNSIAPGAIRAPGDPQIRVIEMQRLPSFDRRRRIPADGHQRAFATVRFMPLQLQALNRLSGLRIALFAGRSFCPGPLI